MDAPTDRELVKAVIDGDTEAFTFLVDRYRNTYTRFVVRMLGSRDDAEDVLQSAFVRAYRALHRCEDPDRFAPWLYQIVVNECRTFLSRRTKRERRFVADAGAADPATEDPWLALGVRDDILRAVGQLTVEQREAFLLKHVEDLSYEEMRTLTGVNESTLKMRVKRACERLRELLERVPE